MMPDRIGIERRPHPGIGGQDKAIAIDEQHRIGKRRHERFDLRARSLVCGRGDAMAGVGLRCSAEGPDVR